MWLLVQFPLTKLRIEWMERIEWGGFDIGARTGLLEPKELFVGAAWFQRAFAARGGIAFSACSCIGGIK